MYKGFKTGSFRVLILYRICTGQTPSGTRVINNIGYLETIEFSLFFLSFQVAEII